MLERTRRDLLNWFKKRKRTKQMWLYLSEKGKISQVIESLDTVVLQDPKHKVFVEPSDLEDVFREGACRLKKREQPITPEFIQEILGTLLTVDTIPGPEDYMFTLSLELYTGKKDKKFYIDSFARLRNTPGWSKVWTIEYTVIPY